MSRPLTVIIAAQEALPALAAAFGTAKGQVLTFGSTDALRALELITEQRPDTVAIERSFASSTRGAALISRIMQDATLTGCEIRVLPKASETAQPAVAPGPLPSLPAPLDKKGTRRAPRYAIRDSVEVSIDGKPAQLVDLSAVGAQVVSPSLLRPNQRVRVTFADEHASTRAIGSIAWAEFQMPGRSSTPHYRAGVEFLDVDAKAISAFCDRHRR